MTDKANDPLAKGLEAAQLWVTEVNKANGWYDADRTFGDEIALLHSEVSEMLEAYREHGLTDVTGQTTTISFDPPAQYVKPEGVGSEVADVLVRLLDFCERHGIDLYDEFLRKMAYNETRGYRHGGKKL
jgi:NTP pyrophosphatase (non-canonical NTP hydrolase)